MNLLIIDAQGGGIGRALIERLKSLSPAPDITAAGTNAMATQAMLKAGADRAATGENAILYCVREADIIAGPIGIVMKNAMLGEITGSVAAAVGESRADKVLIPVKKCRTEVAGAADLPLQKLLDDAARLIAQKIKRGSD